MSTAASSWATEPIQVLGRPTRASSPAGNQQKENFVARSATPIPIRLVILAARPGRLIHDPNKDAERCGAAWGRRLAEARGSCSLQCNTERKPGRQPGPQGGFHAPFHYLSAPGTTGSRAPTTR